MGRDITVGGLCRDADYSPYTPPLASGLGLADVNTEDIFTVRHDEDTAINCTYHIASLLLGAIILTIE